MKFKATATSDSSCFPSHTINNSAHQFGNIRTLVFCERPGSPAVTPKYRRILAKGVTGSQANNHPPMQLVSPGNT